MKRTRLQDESGAVAVVVALCIVMFVLFSAVVVDVGYWYNVRRQLQAAADAAALAGCHELILDKTDDEIWTTVMDYVEANTVIPADTTITVVPPQAGGDSDIGEDFVKVTVFRETRSFFGGILGIAQTPIVAQAKAAIGYATEGRSLVPFSVPIILPGEETDVIARVGGAEEELDPAGDDAYVGDIAFSRTPGANKAYSYPLTLQVYNSMGVLAEDFDGNPVARAIVRHADFPITDVWWERPSGEDASWVDPGTPMRLRISTLGANDKPDVSIKGPGANVNNASVQRLSDGQWYVNFTPPSDMVARYGMYLATVSVKIGKTTYEFEGKEPAAVLVARRSNAPIDRVDASPLVFTGGGSHSIDLWVGFTRYQISYDASGPEYALMVDDGGGAESGNFGTVDFRTVVAPDWPPYDNDREYDSKLISGNWYSWALENGWIGDVRIGDAMQTYTGISGGATESGLEDRFGSNSVSFASWLDAGSPASPRVLTVPIVEKIEEVSGRSWVAVVAFGAFYVEHYDKRESLITGHFIEYIGASGGSTAEPGGSGLYLETPHLVSEDVQY